MKAELHFFKASIYTLVTFICLLLFSACARQVSQPTLDVMIPDYLKKNAFTSKEAIVLKDNDLAFASKIDIIQKAQKELRLIYYIYDPDETTSYMTNEIIKKVQNNPDFKVKLLTDYQFNYKNLDFFRWLEKQQPHGKQQIEVRFYNRPGKEVIKFAEFMTMGCANGGAEGASLQCKEQKLAYLKKFDAMTLAEAEDAMSVEAKIFLAGFYAKDPNGIQFGTQLGYARDLQTVMENPEAKPTMDKSQKENLKKVMTLYWASKTGSTAKRIEANVQLAILGLFFGKELQPFLEGLETLLPFSAKDAQNTTLMTNPEISYITDYTHHKFLLGDKSTAQIGGRNCANAYHMHPNPLEEKYIFMDTDLYLNLDESGGDLFYNTFEKLWNFKNMVATTQEIETHAPIGFLYLINKANSVAKSICAEESDPLKQMGCAGQVFYNLLSDGYDDLVIDQQRDWESKFSSYISTYTNSYLLKENPEKNWTELHDIFNSSDGYAQEGYTLRNPLHEVNTITVSDQKMYYVENVPYDLSIDMSANAHKRSFGSEYGKEIEHGKMIHKLWEDAIEAACAKSENSEEPIEVIIHQGYFAPSEGMVLEMNRLMNEKICPNVKLKLYTNSITTTDLTPINFIGRRQLHALIQKNSSFKTDRFEYYEYSKDKLSTIVKDTFTASDGSGGKGSYSLHTKVIIFDDDIYLGSSNAEFRSYMMDTNNGVFIKDVPELIKTYKDHFATLKDRNILVDAKQSLYFKDLKELRAQEEKDITELRQRYDLDNRSFMVKRKAQFEYAIKQLYNTLDQVSSEMKKSVRKRKLKGSSKLDQMLKVF